MQATCYQLQTTEFQGNHVSQFNTENLKKFVSN